MKPVEIFTQVEKFVEGIRSVDSEVSATVNIHPAVTVVVKKNVEGDVYIKLKIQRKNKKEADALADAIIVPNATEFAFEYDKEYNKRNGKPVHEYNYSALINKLEEGEEVEETVEDEEDLDDELFNDLEISESDETSEEEETEEESDEDEIEKDLDDEQ